MSLYVLKFGGSSVATPARIKHVAEIVSEFVREGNRVVVVTSAMQGVTDSLIELTKNFSDDPFDREYDAVISSGEQVAAGLLAMALNTIGIPAKSMNAWQAQIKAVGDFSESWIKKVNEKKIFAELEFGIVPVVTGFQGITRDGDICTIGRGGSDATACAIAKAISADECLIYTDVDGVYTADPRVVIEAKKIEEISYDDMIELANWGAKVLQARSVKIAKEYNVNLRVLSSFSDSNGTKISNKTEHVLKHNIVGIAHNFDYFILKVRNYKEARQCVSSFIKKNFGQEFSESKEGKLVSSHAGSFLIPKNYQNDVKNIMDKEGLFFEFDNDVGMITVVGDLCSYIDEKDSMAFKNYGRNLHGPKGKVLNLNETIYRIHDVVYGNDVELKKMLENDISISIIVPFQQTVPLVNKLHETFLNT